MLLELLASLSIGIMATGEIDSSDAFINESTPTLKIEYGKDFYGWGTVNRSDQRLLGQKISTSWVGGAGVGYSFNIFDNLKLFGEGGYAYPFNTNNKDIQQEVAYTYLVGRHAVPGRPVPVEIQYPYDKESYGSEWDIDGDFTFRVGAKVEINEHWSLSASYNYFKPDGYVAIFDEDVRYGDEPGGWWEESVKMDMSVIEAGVHYSF